MKFAVLDLETTGSLDTDRIIQLGLSIVEDGRIVQTYSSFVNPGIPIPGIITQLTGIDDSCVHDAPTIDDVLLECIPLLADSILVGHHVSFDFGFLQRALAEAGYDPFTGRVLDTIDLLRIAFPSLPSLQLRMVTQALGIAHVRPHQADSDAEATAGVLILCLERLASLPLITAQRLAQLFASSAATFELQDLAWLFGHIVHTKEAGLTLDTDAVNYYRGFALHITDWTEEQPARSDEDANEEETMPFSSFLEHVKESLQQQFEAFEHREEQETMIGEVMDAMDQSRHLMIEAGTGTGKSLAYMIPALYYGIHEDRKVIVSTNTIQLQEQLLKRDIPLLQNIFPHPFRASVLKGRNHYLCLRKFEHKINMLDYEMTKENTVTAAQMVVWLGETGSGDEQEIHFGQHGTSFWRTVESDTDSCLNRACPWFKKCFYHRARHESNISDLVITNHALLLSDVQADNRLLPAYDHLVIDEAHHFEEVAGKHLGIQVSYFAVVNTLSMLVKDSRTGNLPALRFRLSQAEPDRTAKWCEQLDELMPRVVAVKEQWDEFCELLFKDISGHNADSSQGEGGPLVVRIKPETPLPNWDAIGSAEDNIYVELGGIVKQLERLVDELKDDQDEFDVQGLLTDLSGFLKYLARHRDNARFVTRMSDQEFVYWVEASQYYRSKSITLTAVPIDVSPKLKEHFFDAKSSVVLTSATLSVNKSFQYSCELLGLNPSGQDGNVRTVQLASPFNYREHALVCIPRDFPTVKGSNDPVFTSKLAESLRDVAIQTRGRMLVLFTSYRMLKSVHEQLKPELAPYGIQVLGQGIDSGNRSKLTRLFQANRETVLLGTSSFWEGVDIPGDALSCLAIVRLPFQPPNHPLVEAKCEAIKKANENPFMKHSVPQAVIRFKQGFGRLVRNATDRGVVIIYDTRVLHSHYGKYFLYSLPGPKIEHMPTNQLADRAGEWLAAVEPMEEEQSS